MRALTTLYLNLNPFMAGMPLTAYQRLLLSHVPSLDQIDAGMVAPALKAAAVRDLGRLGSGGAAAAAAASADDAMES
jgi:hypothetical protein